MTVSDLFISSASWQATIATLGRAHWLLLLAVAMPLLGSTVLPLIGRRSQSARNALGLLLVASTFGFAAALLPHVLAGEQVLVRVGTMSILQADKLAVFMACVSTLVGAIIVYYSFDYISHSEHANEYYFMVVLFLGAMMGIAFSANLIGLYVFWELTAFASWRLIGFFRNRQYVIKADKAFMITVFGAVVMLLGFVAVYAEHGTFDLPKLAAARAPLSNLGAALMLVGILSKSATLPLHTWLPDAGVAPSPVTALLHAAVLVKIGVYVFARLFVASFAVAEIWQEIVPWVAAASAIVSAGAALIDTDLKRIIAFSTISQIGFIFLGLSVGGDVAVGGGLLYIMMHGIAKGGLFLCAGIIEHQTHTKDIRKLGGLFATMPVTAVSFALCAFSVIGIPPFGGFFSKYLVMVGAVERGHTAVALVFLFGAFLTILYLLRLFTMVFLGEAKDPALCKKEGSRRMVVSVALLAGLSLASGLFVAWPSAMLQATVHEIVGNVK